MKKFMGALLVMTALLTAFCVSVSAQTYSGTCGDNVSWTFDDTTGVLNISGSGDMESYSSSASVPWSSYKSYITTVTIDNGVTGIGDYAFYGCTELVSITIPKDVTSIGECAFDGCYGLERIAIPKDVRTIESQTFRNCTSLEDVVIPDSVKTIKVEAFGGCTALTNVYYSGTSEDWTGITIGSENEHLTGASFFYQIGVCGENVWWSFDSETGALTIFGIGGMDSYYDLADVPWDKYRKEICSADITEGVTSIGDYAFDSCYNLTSITIPDSVTSIGGCAFFDCYNLASITIGSGVRNIEDYAFYCCESLVNITIPDGVTNIGKGAFYYCTSITSITIPDRDCDKIGLNQ